MTTVVFDPGRGVLTLSGHAGAGEKGRDLVCAALSILAETAAALPGAQTRRGAGRCEVRAEPERLAALTPGFALLARDFPAYVKYEEETA